MNSSDFTMTMNITIAMLVMVLAVFAMTITNLRPDAMAWRAYNECLDKLNGPNNTIGLGLEEFTECNNQGVEVGN